MPAPRRIAGAAGCLLALAASACSTSSPSSSASAIATASPPQSSTPSSSTTSTATITSTASASATSSASLAGCPAPAAFSRLVPLAHEGVDIDDVTATPDGNIWITAVDAGRVMELDASGRSLRTIVDANGPEGIVPVAGGVLALAEQKANRVVRLDPATGTTSPLLDVPNRTANEGVDGIAYDSARSRLLVPDSANGRLLAVALGGDGAAAGPSTVLATGLGRPVAAWPEADGSVDVGVENAPGLVRVAATGGGVTPLVPSGTLAQVDEVIGEGGLLYVTDLTLHVAVAVDPTSGRTMRLVTGAGDPQGLALLPDGRLLLVESTSRTLTAITPCG